MSGQCYLVTKDGFLEKLDFSCGDSFSHLPATASYRPWLLVPSQDEDRSIVHGLVLIGPRLAEIDPLGSAVHAYGRYVVMAELQPRNS